MKKRFTLLGALVLVALAAFVAVTKANPPSGVTPTLLARGTYDPFNVRSDPQGPIADFRAHSTGPIDIVVQKHDYAPGGTRAGTSTQARSSSVSRRERSRSTSTTTRTCTPHVYSKGQGFVDTGDGHIGFNRTDQPASDVTVAIAPVGGAFRTELPAPNPYCGF